MGASGRQGRSLFAGVREVGADRMGTGRAPVSCRDYSSGKGHEPRGLGRKEPEWQGALLEVTNAYLLQVTTEPWK